MKKIQLLFVLLTTVFYCNAQDIINGKVLDGAGVPVPFATVKLSLKESANPIGIKLTDLNGNFQLRSAGTGDRIITVTEVAHETLTTAVLPLKRNSADTLILVLKKRENTLSGVTITARKKLITQKIDRLVMNISNNSLSAGKSSMEIFSMAPGVFVNNGSISINGNAGTRVMVNGKILQLSGDDLTAYLNNLRAEDIESVEVIAHPPAEYEAQGTGGMLNIILKKQTSYGFNGSLNAGYTQGRYAGTDEGLRLNFKDKKVAVYTNYGFNMLKSYEDSRISRQYVNAPYQFQETANRIVTNNGHRVNAGVVYDISAKQYIGIDYVGSFSKNVSSYSSVARIDYPGNADDITNKGTSPTDTKTNYNNAGINYNLTLDTLGSGLLVLADYTGNKLSKASAANSNVYNYRGEFLSDTAFRNFTPSEAAIYTADIRYTKILNNKNSLSAGVKGASAMIDNSANFEGFNNGIWQANPGQDYIYDYREKILAGYFNFAGRMWDMDVKLGLRGEYTAMSGNLVTSGVLTKSNYFNLFPSLFLKHGVNKDNSNYLTAYYGRRLSRPDYNKLNPYESYIDNYSVARGNPYLTPSYTDVYELGFTLKNKYLFKAAYQNDKGLISEFIKADDQNPLLWIYTYLNYGKNTNLSLSANIPVQITRWWSSNTNISFMDQQIETPDLEIKKGIVYFQTNHDFKVGKNTGINLSGFYISNVISGNVLADNLYSFNIGAQQKLLKDKLLLRATISDPFYIYRIKATTTYRDYSSRVAQDRQTRTFSLSLTYNFDLGKTFKARKLQKSSEEEENRL